MGESAVASWGFTAGVDATAGTQPWVRLVEKAADSTCWGALSLSLPFLCTHTRLHHRASLYITTHRQGTRFTNNICREIGMYEKQVSCYFAATSAQAVVSQNIMFNMPRAAVNFNGASTLCPSVCQRPIFVSAPHSHLLY